MADVKSRAGRADGWIPGAKGCEGHVVGRGDNGTGVAGLDEVELVAAGGHAGLDGRRRADAVAGGFGRRGGGGGHFGGAGDADTVVEAGDDVCTACRTC